MTIVASVLLLASSGCRSTDDYQKLANAGTKYVKAIDQLLIVAVDIRVDATSEQLLRNDRILNQSVDNYLNLSQIDTDRIKFINDLRVHNRLLKRYFSQLQELATSNAPETAQREVEGIVDNLNKAGQRLRSSPLFSNRDTFGAIAGFIVNSQIRGALRQELEKRGKTITLELKTQQELLNVVAGMIQQDINSIKVAQEQRLVVRPLIQPQPISDEDSWVRVRRKIVLMQGSVIQLEEASLAVSDFSEAFRAFVEGKSSKERINTLLADVESLLEVVETLKK